MRVVAVASNKGGVGKTTVVGNLAIYLRALREDLPVLVVGLDDQSVLDRMFAVEPIAPDQPNVKHAWAERAFDRAIRLGQYGVHFVPSPPETAALKARAEDPKTLSRILARSKWEGVVIFDTKSDLEALTRNALYAADRVILPVADRASLEEAGKVFTILARARRSERARMLLTLVDARTRVEPRGGLDLRALLEREIERRRWPRYRTHLSRSPRAEALISAGGIPLSILHHARGTAIHRQMRELAEELLADLSLGAPTRAPSARRVVPAPDFRRSGIADWKSALLRGLRGR
jgi:cellulose biosynthesis protein BcsQ